MSHDFEPSIGAIEGGSDEVHSPRSSFPAAVSNPLGEPLSDRAREMLKAGIESARRGEVKPLQLGRKDDSGKLRFDLIDPDFEEGLAGVLTHGAEKYGANNWQHVKEPRERYYAALRRHLAAWRKGETTDRDSGRAHLLHVACCVMFLYWLDRKETNR